MKPVLAACAIVLLGIIPARSAMAFFDKLYLFSEVNGVVLDNGQPISNAEIVQTCSLAEKERSYTTKTDSEGRFYLPAITSAPTLSSLLPGEVFIKQKITIRVNGEQYRAWSTDKRNYDKNGELRESNSKPWEAKTYPINIICDIITPDDMLSTRTKIALVHSPFGICTLAN